MPAFWFEGHNSHTDLFVDHLARTGTGTLAATADDADAVCVFERDAATHLGLALPHLRAGRAVFVDKPVALHTDEVAAMAGAGTLTSFSTLRWAAGLDALRGSTTVRISGPARPDDPSGYAFYAVHAVEIAHQLCGGSPGPVEVRRDGDDLTATYCLDDREVQLDLSPALSDWAVEATDATGTHHLLVTAASGYYEPASRRLVEFAVTRNPPVPAADLISVVRVLEALPG